MVIRATNIGFSSVAMRLEIDWSNKVIAIVVEQYTGREHQHKAFAADEFGEALEQYKIWEENLE